MRATLPPPQTQLLQLIGEHRFATTHQLSRLTTHQYGSYRSANRQTLRHLRELQKYRLITRLERRVGGWQGGSQISVWTFTTTGRRHLTGNTGRVRPHHHSTAFLSHSLAVTEARVVLHEATQSTGLELSIQNEPQCWRNHLDSHGSTTTLRPDLMATIVSENFVDRYFIEVDRDTENPARIIRKSRQYLHYQRTGIEQEHHGVYPAVIWLVPHKKRQQQLRDAIRSEPELPRDLFTVIILPELTDLVRDGPKQPQ